MQAIVSMQARKENTLTWNDSTMSKFLYTDIGVYQLVENKNTKCFLKTEITYLLPR